MVLKTISRVSSGVKTFSGTRGLPRAEGSRDSRLLKFRL
jgi:hypothetical protein